jgi:hypothetical protein
MLCGLVDPYGELPGDALEQAKWNLRERFEYVGTTERFDEFLSMLNLELGWPTTPYKRARANPARATSEAASDEVRRVAAERNVLDRDLHAFAGVLLEEALARVGPELGRELEVLRRSLARWGDGGAVGRVPAGGESIRSLSIDARVELALKEAELVASALELRRLTVKLKRAKLR